MMRSIAATISLLLLGYCSALAYTKLSTKVYQSDGSASDTQAAIDAASDGYTVQIPNGTYTWNSEVGIWTKAIHLMAQSPGGVTINDPDTATDMLGINEALGGSVELSGINFSSPDNNVYGFMVHVFHVEGGKPVLLHDCTFSSGYRYALGWTTNGGVIWNCTFRGHMLSGISFVWTLAPLSAWNSPSTFGMDEVNGTANTYVEDCTFTDSETGCINNDDNTRVVLRHNTFKDAAVSGHGQETGTWGARAFEVYDNTFIYDSSGTTWDGRSYPLGLNYWFMMRGGTGTIANNVCPDIPGKSGILLTVFSINRATAILPCQTSYPAARQIGQSWKGAGGYSYPNVPQDGTGYYTDPIYIWGNTGTGSTQPNFVGLDQYTPDDCGNGQKVADYVKLGRDYILGAKPGYTPYTYPHPLRNSVHSVLATTTLRPPQNVRIAH